MKRKTLKKALSAFLSLLMCMMTLLSISTPVFAATTVDAYMVDFPRDGDSNYSATAWGHSATSLMGGWRFLNSKYTTVHSIGTYNGQVSYCIEPGIGQNAGDTLSHKDETFWENYPSHLNPTISPDTIKVLLGRIMQYGYQGNVSTSWRSQNASDAAALSYAIATQLLVWETVVGERDASFNKVYPSGYGKSAVWSYIRDEHPLRSQIRSYYNSMAASVQSHAEIPSFCARSIGSARSYELKYDGTRYTVTLTDTNGVLSNFSFSSSEPGISFSRSGNRLTITSDTPIAGDIRVSASKTNGVRSGVVVWTDGNKGAGIQDVVTYGENVSDPVSAYLRLEMEALGTMHLVKTSEDGVVANISFTISGNGITKTVTTGRDGTIDVSELMAGTYTVTEADIERYTPQTSQQVTIVGGQTSTVTFNNVLKRGALEVTKTSEDGFVEGVKFRLYGKSLSGLNVDEYAVTDSTGVAKFRNVLIGGPYTIEEVDTAIRYVIPDPQSVSIQWNRVAERSFANILKKFTVTVTKTDAETGTPQGDATLSGAKYGIYKGGKLVDVYYTDAKGQFTSKEYICDTDWTIREMEPSEGYLLDTTEHTVGAAPGQYTVEHNTTANAVTETVIKGSIRLIKHIDAELETSENAPTPQAEAEIPAATDPSAPEGSAYFVSPDAAALEDAQETAASDDAKDTAEPAAEETPMPDQADTETPAESEPEAADTLIPGQNEAEPEPENGSVPAAEFNPSGNAGIIEQPEAGAMFQLYLSGAGSYDAAKDSERDLLVTDENGVVLSKDLPYGRYTVHQIEGQEGQAFVPDFTVFISSDEHLYSYILNNQTITSFIRVEKRDAETGKLVKLIANEGAVIENKLIYGSVSGLKVDANDKPLSGAVMGLFAASETKFTKDTALLTAVSAEDGRFRFEKIPAGNWLVREIEQPKGFVLSEELFPVTVKEQGQVIEIKIANKLIRGSVTLTKYDADYPENKLSGAVFEVYRDVNGNKALDKDDVLLGTMEESSAGVYWMKNLEYGGVLVREKTAPEGFIPDEKAYYVEIDTDGKTYTVENEAGKGFINHALKGSLKIIKTTSDGKKEGFAFRITGANGYDMTFTTDAKGEIFIEKLRIGEYTVTELKNSASEGYKIADPVKITLVANETLTVKIHNDKTKVDVPKTGDDADLILWISLLGLAAAGAGCTAFFYLKKRRTSKHIAAKK